MAYRGKHEPQKSIKESNKHGKGGKAVLIVTIVILVLVILFCAAMIAVNSYLNKINRVGDDIEIIPPDEVDSDIDKDDNTEDLPSTSADEIEWWESDGLDDDHLINIMLVGQDSRDSSRQRSDAMILCSINPDTGKISLTSFLRDLYIQMPEGYSDTRMNAAYYVGGFPFLYEVMETNFGITCDGGIEVNFDGFKEVIDAIGGVDVELTYSEANIVGGGAYEGMNHLDGEQALEYSRIRKLDSDFGRTERQRTVLLAMLESIRNLSATELLKLVNTLIPMVTTDMTNSQIIDVAMVVLPLISDLELESHRIPTDDAYYPTYINEMAVLVPDLELCQKYLREEFLPFN